MRGLNCDFAAAKEWARDYTGIDDGATITAVQRIHITPEGKKDTTRGGTGSDMPAKITNGVLRGAYVRLPRMLADTTLIIAEGPETGLSAWVSTGCETWLRLGNIATATPPQGRQVVMAADDDPQDSPAAAALAKKLSEWRASGAKVALATAWPDRRYDKSDLNDTIKAGGLVAVRERIKAAIATITEDPKPEHAMPTLTVEEAGEPRRLGKDLDHPRSREGPGRGQEAREPPGQPWRFPDADAAPARRGLGIHLQGHRGALREARHSDEPLQRRGWAQLSRELHVRSRPGEAVA